MAQGPLNQSGYKPGFTGHETFPLRYGWLKKAYDRVAETESESDNREACWGDTAIAKFGVGKNMVASMRFWAKASGIVEETGRSSVCPTTLGRMLFAPNGLDPYMEHPATLWLIHWHLASNQERTTWYWAFGHYPAITFERDSISRGLLRLARENNWIRFANATLKSDVACFIRTYTARHGASRVSHDDTLESPLAELALIRSVGRRDGFRFVRGAKPTLGDGVFVYALMHFWRNYSESRTLSFEAVAHTPGGPGRVFLLNEDDVADRLEALEGTTDGKLRWSETAGLKQIVRDIDLSEESVTRWLRNDYGARENTGAPDVTP